MKRVIIDVFPTPWSPKNTSLYFARGEIFGVAPADTAWLTWSLVDEVADVDAIIDMLVDGNNILTIVSVYLLLLLIFNIILSCIKKTVQNSFLTLSAD